MLADEGEARLWPGIDGRASDNLNGAARACLRHILIKALSDLFTPALYERLVKARKEVSARDRTAQAHAGGTGSVYDRFITGLQAGGFRRLFEEKPVLLRLAAIITRQWIDTSAVFVRRLDADLDAVRRDLLGRSLHCGVTAIEDDLSDPHNGGRSVQIVGFEDGSRVVYKPKDLRLDAAWYTLVERLNCADAPDELRAARTIVRDGYGWTEFIDHLECEDADAAKRFYRRAGAWLALFHCFAASDMHQENMIAAGDHPVPIDLEMILQGTADEQRLSQLEAQAHEAARDIIANSVMSVGLLPAYGRSPENKLFAIGGMTSDWTARSKVVWTDVNTDAMRPRKIKVCSSAIPNLPYIGGRYAKLGDHLEDFIRGFENYAAFLKEKGRAVDHGGIFENFADLPVRKVVRPTRFYSVLLQRLRNHRTMDDGATWSAQADFIARLSDWEHDSDILWPLQRSERTALLKLDVPYFASPSDGNEISDAAGAAVQTTATSGLQRAGARLRSFDNREIGWQVAVIRQNTSLLGHSEAKATQRPEPKQSLPSAATSMPAKEIFVAEASKVADDLTRYCIRRGVASRLDRP